MLTMAAASCGYEVGRWGEICRSGSVLAVGKIRFGRRSNSVMRLLGWRALCRPSVMRFLLPSIFYTCVELTATWILG